VRPQSSGFWPHLMHFLWVRWLDDKLRWKSGRRQAHLPKIGFGLDTDDYAFGFLDPTMVIRGSHLLPDFVGGRTHELLQTVESTAACEDQEDDNWANYHVNIFVDRDMVMRYFGGGISHLDNNWLHQWMLWKRSYLMTRMPKRKTKN
ncbi:hypothetical protein ARMGADRAFT_947896, partial [Armillaria gallica]